jgi:hypothetical protein
LSLSPKQFRTTLPIPPVKIPPLYSKGESTDSKENNGSLFLRERAPLLLTK